MEIKFVTLLLLAFSFLTGCDLKNYAYEDGRLSNSSSYEESTDDEMPNEPDKCYERCVIVDDYYELSDNSYYKYTGDNPYQFGIESIYLEIAPESVKWIKKKADKNCLSADPQDCLVWCLQPTPRQTRRIYVVTDTTAFSEWKELETGNKVILKAIYGTEKWKEALCENMYELDTVYSQICKMLSVNGYYDYKADSLDCDTELEFFQEEKGLPLGYWNLETLSALGIEY